MSRRIVTLALLLLLPATAAAASRSTPRAAVPRGMVRIPGGSYRPLYATSDTVRIPVRTFALHRLPVTRGEFLAFVHTHAAWRRGAVRPLFADRGYLAGWPAALDAGTPADLARPVTGVSWFAARAYCRAAGGRLPTVDEWEFAADDSRVTGDTSVARRRALAALYAARRPGPLPRAGASPANAYGVRGLHGVTWEWTLDFNSAVVSDDSRASGSGTDARNHRLACASAAISATDPTDYPAFARFANRAGLTARSSLSGLGFRCAADLPG